MYGGGHGRGVVSGFEAGIRANPRVGTPQFSGGVAESGSIGVSRPVDRIGRAHIAKPNQENIGGRVSEAIAAFFRLLTCVVLLLTIGAASFLYADTPAPQFVSHYLPWIGLGELLLPLTFFAIQLANRRYGPGYAMAQVFLAWGIGFAALPFIKGELAQLLSASPPDLRDVAGFGCALFLAHLLSVLVFDRMRGPRWWTAPLISSLVAGIVFCLIAFPAAYLGTAVADWPDRMIGDMGVMAVAAFAMLIPYWLLRSVVPPLPGFNGY